MRPDLQVQDVAHVGLVTSSMDSRILITDISREKIIQCATHHKKGVMDFAWCKAYSLFASCSERTIVLWQGNTARKISELPGHAAPIMSLAIDEVYVLCTRCVCAVLVCICCVRMLCAGICAVCLHVEGDCVSALLPANPGHSGCPQQHDLANRAGEPPRWFRRA